MTQHTDDNPQVGDGPPPRQRRRPPMAAPPGTGEVPALGPAGPDPTRVVIIAVTELTRVAQDLTYPLARGGVETIAGDLGATFTRLDCASRVMAQAARLAQLATPAGDPELDQS